MKRPLKVAGAAGILVLAASGLANLLSMAAIIALTPKERA